MSQTSKKSNFLVVNTIIGDLKHSLLIQDYIFWTVHEDEMDKWCKDMFNKPMQHKGMFVKFDSCEDRTLFLMKWANG